MVAFLSDRAEDGKFQLYIIRREGGEAIQLTFQQGVSTPVREVPRYTWSPDGRSIAFLMQDAEDEESRRRREGGDDAVEFEYAPRYTRVWVVDIDSKLIRRVTTGDVQVWEFDWSPDGKEFALIVSDAPYEWSWYKARLAKVSSKGGLPNTILESKKQLAHPRWSPDGREIAYLSSIWSDRGIVSGDLNLVRLRGATRADSRLQRQHRLGSMVGGRTYHPRRILRRGRSYAQYLRRSDVGSSAVVEGIVTCCRAVLAPLQLSPGRYDCDRARFAECAARCLGRPGDTWANKMDSVDQIQSSISGDHAWRAASR